MKLIGSLASPYTRKVRIVLAEKKIDYDFEIDNPWKADAKAAKLNPLGKVPALLLDDGRTLFDSRVIVGFLDNASPIARLVPAENRERVEVRRWEALADGVLDAGVLARLENQREAKLRSAPWIERQMGKVRAGLAALDSELADKPWCVGNGYSLADIAVGVCLGWLDFRYPKMDWKKSHANLARAFAKLSERASFADTVPKEGPPSNARNARQSRRAERPRAFHLCADRRRAPRPLPPRWTRRRRRIRHRSVFHRRIRFRAAHRDAQDHPSGTRGAAGGHRHRFRFPADAFRGMGPRPGRSRHGCMDFLAYTRAEGPRTGAAAWRHRRARHRLDDRVLTQPPRGGRRARRRGRPRPRSRRRRGGDPRRLADPWPVRHCGRSWGGRVPAGADDHRKKNSCGRDLHARRCGRHDAARCRRHDRRAAAVVRCRRAHAGAGRGKPAGERGCAGLAAGAAAVLLRALRGRNRLRARLARGRLTVPQE